MFSSDRRATVFPCNFLLLYAEPSVLGAAPAHILPINDKSEQFSEKPNKFVSDDLLSSFPIQKYFLQLSHGCLSKFGDISRLHPKCNWWINMVSCSWWWSCFQLSSDEKENVFADRIRKRSLNQHFTCCELLGFTIHHRIHFKCRQPAGCFKNNRVLLPAIILEQEQLRMQLTRQDNFE